MIAAVIACGALLGITPPSASAATRYCDTNSIIRCGALTAPELQQKYAANEGDLQAIFAHYGITSTMIAEAGSAKMGTVTKSGDVIVDGKVIATAAQSVGRHTTSGSTAVQIGNTTVYQRATSNVFIDEQQSAFVFLDNEGQFKVAIITSCGNPVVATPTPKPKPQPVYACDSLTASKIDRVTYRFTPKASATNATVTKYIINFGDGTTETVAASQTTVNHTYSKAGNYSTRLTAVFDVEGRERTDSGASCQVSISVDTEPCPLPGKEAYPKDSPNCKEDTPPVTPPQPPLPSTGPMDFLGGTIAVGSLTAAGYYWQSSRRQLIDRFLNRK